MKFVSLALLIFVLLLSSPASTASIADDSDRAAITCVVPRIVKDALYEELLSGYGENFAAIFLRAFDKAAAISRLDEAKCLEKPAVKFLLRDIVRAYETDVPGSTDSVPSAAEKVIEQLFSPVVKY